MSSASRRARPSVSSASRRASAIAWSAVCCASASTRAAVSMLSSAGGMPIIGGSGLRSGSGRGGSGAIISGGSAMGELSADIGTLPPRSTSASLARSSSFSWSSRSSSASTSSRKASTSSSSYPGLSLVVLNCLFRTSAGVSGISSPRRTWVCSLWDRTGSEQLYGVDQEKNNEEQQHEAEVQGNTTEPEHGDEPTQELQGRIGSGVDGLRGHQHCTSRTPVAGERLNPAEDQPPEQEQQVQPERICQNDLYDAHGPVLSSQPTAGRPLRGRRAVLSVTRCLTLVEEPSFRHPRLVLGRDLDVRRRQQEHLVRHPLDAASEAKDQARREVDKALGVAVDHFSQVHDHRSALAEVLPDRTSLIVCPRVQRRDASQIRGMQRHPRRVCGTGIQ